MWVPRKKHRGIQSKVGRPSANLKIGSGIIDLNFELTFGEAPTWQFLASQLYAVIGPVILP